MFQIDKLTFIATLYGTFICYFFLYLDFSVTYLYKFLTALKLQKTVFKSKSFSFIIFAMPKSFGENLIDFYHIGPLFQGVTSLLTLIFLYWISGHYYNKGLSGSGGWLDFKTRVGLIFFDLSMNLALGLYYMHYRDTLMGAIMMKCPIAISPVIFLLEMICFYIYTRYVKKSK